MKKLLLVAVMATALMSLTACWGIRGYNGNGKVCENQTFLGISIIEVLAPCGK